MVTILTSDLKSASLQGFKRSTECLGCDHTIYERHIAMPDNPNGNGNRLYLLCAQCKRFKAFDDDRGIHPTNPGCYCAMPSRLQVAGAEKGRGLHYVCRTGTCPFYLVCPDSIGKQLILTESELAKAVADHMI